MKSKRMSYAVLFLQGLLIGSYISSIQAHDSRIFDPMIDFRSPHSLTEVLHEGLLSIDGLLQGCIDNNDVMEVSLVTVLSELRQLHSDYDEMINRSKIHTVYRDDREFLQKMIDKIDSMIHDLERSPHLSQQDQQLLNQNIDLVQQLHAKV